MTRGRPREKVTLAVEDARDCDVCGEPVFVHNGDFFCGKECLSEKLEQEQENKDLVGEWVEEFLL